MQTTNTPVEELTPDALLEAAAALMEQRAAAATKGPWRASLVHSPSATVTSGIYSHAHPAGSVASEVAASGRRGKGCGGITRAADAEYIASMDPAVGSAVAAWLRACREPDTPAEMTAMAVDVARAYLATP